MRTNKINFKKTSKLGVYQNNFSKPLLERRERKKRMTVYLELLLEVTLLDVSEFFLDPGLERWGEGGHVRTGDIELKIINM